MWQKIEKSLKRVQRGRFLFEKSLFLSFLMLFWFPRAPCFFFWHLRIKLPFNLRISKKANSAKTFLFAFEIKSAWNKYREMVVEARVRKTSKGKFSSEQYFVFLCSSEWPNKFATSLPDSMTSYLIVGHLLSSMDASIDGWSSSSEMKWFCLRPLAKDQGITWVVVLVLVLVLVVVHHLVHFLIKRNLSEKNYP